MTTAYLVLTAGGLELARRCRADRPGPGAIFGPTAVLGADSSTPGPFPGTFATPFAGEYAWSGPLGAIAPRVWADHGAIVAVMALGIVFRLFGRLAEDKRRDPAVVCVDDAGRFAIAVLGGHLGGANRLADEVARTLGARAVITTAGDSAGLPAVDLIGRDAGWVVERAENLTRVAAAVVRRQAVAVWQDAGDPGWFREFGPWPDHFRKITAWEDLPDLAPAALLVISDRTIPDGLPADRTVVYRPPTLVAGIGCRRGTSRETIERWVATVMDGHGLAGWSLAAVATVMLKIDEPGLIDFARSRDLPLIGFPDHHLAGHPGIETPSERVLAKVGLAAVAEPAALRGAGALRLLVPKQKGPGVTLALARRPDGSDPAPQ